MGISVKLQVFEGPLDLLLHLIDKNKVNIYDIPIAMITEQYMEYVEQLKKEDLNVVSEFLVILSQECYFLRKWMRKAMRKIQEQSLLKSC